MFDLHKPLPEPIEQVRLLWNDFLVKVHEVVRVKRTEFSFKFYEHAMQLLAEIVLVPPKFLPEPTIVVDNKER